jgi:hypothetical protein
LKKAKEIIRLSRKMAEEEVLFNGMEKRFQVVDIVSGEAYGLLWLNLLMFMILLQILLKIIGLLGEG